MTLSCFSLPPNTTLHLLSFPSTYQGQHYFLTHGPTKNRSGVQAKGPSLQTHGTAAATRGMLGSPAQTCPHPGRSDPPRGLSSPISHLLPLPTTPSLVLANCRFRKHQKEMTVFKHVDGFSAILLEFSTTVKEGHQQGTDLAVCAVPRAPENLPGDVISFH